MCFCQLPSSLLAASLVFCTWKGKQKESKLKERGNFMDKFANFIQWGWPPVLWLYDTLTLPILVLWSGWNRTTFVSSVFEICFSTYSGRWRDEQWWNGMKERQRNKRPRLMPLALLRKWTHYQEAKSSIILPQSRSHLYIFPDRALQKQWLEEP